MKNKRLFIALLIAGVFVSGVSISLLLRDKKVGVKVETEVPTSVIKVESNPTQKEILSGPVTAAGSSCKDINLKGMSYKQIMSACSSDDIDSLLKGNPDCVECYLARAEYVYNRAMKFPYEQRIDIEKKVKDIGDDPDLYAFKAALLMTDFVDSYPFLLQEAATDYTKLIAYNPNDVSNYLNRCRALTLYPHVLEKTFLQGVSDCKYVIEKSSSNASAYFHIGLAKLYLKQYEESIEYFSKAIGFAPDAVYHGPGGWPQHVAAYRGRAYMLLRKYDEAIKDYGVAEDDHALAMVYIQLKNKEKAHFYLSKLQLGSDLLWTIYYWRIENDADTATKYLRNIMRDGGADFAKTDNAEYLGDLYKTPEYEALEKEFPESVY